MEHHDQPANTFAYAGGHVEPIAARARGTSEPVGLKLCALRHGQGRRPGLREAWQHRAEPKTAVAQSPHYLAERPQHAMTGGAKGCFGGPVRRIRSVLGQGQQRRQIA